VENQADDDRSESNGRSGIRQTRPDALRPETFLRDYNKRGHR